MSASTRHRIVRPDGKQIHLVPKKGHLIVCARGCCCGRTDRGNPAVPIDFYKSEFQRRKLRKHAQLTMSGCIGPCPMLNAVQLVFDGRPIWLQSVNTTAQVEEIYDYLERMLAADRFLPPPATLTEFVFDYYRWNHTNAVEGMPTGPSASETAGTGGFLFLTHADTDLQSLQGCLAELPAEFPSVEAHSLNGLVNEERMQTLIDSHGRAARVIVLRVLGNAGAVPGIEALVASARGLGQPLLVINAVGLDQESLALSTVAPTVLQRVSDYLHAGGQANFGQCLRYLADHLLMTGFGCDAPAMLPEHGVYRATEHNPHWPTVGLLFYRSHWMSGNLAFVDVLIDALNRRGANVTAVYTTSLKQPSSRTRLAQTAKIVHWPAAFDFLCDELTGEPRVDMLITTTSHALAEAENVASDESIRSALQSLGVPIVQAITSGAPRWQWEVSSRGLNPLDTAMNVALPEFDGRIISVPISFKEKSQPGGRQADAAKTSAAQTVELSHYEPVPDRVERVAGIALRQARLRALPNAHKRVAVILTNSTAKAGRIGNAVGLDAPASLIRLLHALQQAGYDVGSIPASGDELIHALIDRCSYDETLLTEEQLRNAAGLVPVAQYAAWFEDLPATQRQQMEQQWGPAPGTAFVQDDAIALAGLELSNVFVALQPPRGYGMDPGAIYHRPDLPPPHHYYALYRWLRDEWQADAVIHLGKHGTLEWLPGKGLGLSSDCFPDSFLGDMPFIYPFIVNDPGEGSQAKRRTHAVIIDHLVPPMTTADVYGPLAELTRLVDEYYQVEQLDRSKLPLVQQQIWELIKAAHLDEDLKRLMTSDHGHTHEWDEGTTEDGTPLTLAAMQGTEVAHVVEELDAYLCDLTGAQIRDGLHILGDAPRGEQLVGLLHAITRIANLDSPSLVGSVAALFGLDYSQLVEDRGTRFDVAATTTAHLGDLEEFAGRSLATHSDAIETIDELSRHLLTVLQDEDFAAACIPDVLQRMFPAWNVLSVEQQTAAANVEAVLAFVCSTLCPKLKQTKLELDRVLEALSGRYIPAGPSGAPTRGMAHVLPTGRNFYAVDPRAIPSASAWQVGQGLAREVLERHLRETNAYPESVGISVWGTSSMRTQGDDVAQVLAFLGARPRWQRESRRLVGVELIPLAELGRPRIDVVVRISGFFRDAFPHLIRLLDEAVELATQADEPLEMNFPRKHYLAELDAALAEGECEHAADRRARYRIFGCRPGSYGAGILPLMEEGNWETDQDLAEVYVNWGGYAYTADEQGLDARDVFRTRLRGVQVALHNQDNREHDIFDSDDYFQFHGGMIATIRALTGKQPKHYFGDSQDPTRPVVRDLKSEVLRVFRTRVANPKWLESIRRHGYRGALELSATVDYLFGYDATAGVVDDWMYAEVAQSYVLDPEMRQLFEQSNPWAQRTIVERLLEAVDRGLWSNPSAELLQALRDAALNAEAILEARGETVQGRPAIRLSDAENRS